MKNVLLFYVLVFSGFAFAQQVRPVKNVVVMIPDGTSVGVYSAARWYKVYNRLGESLHVDPYMTGTVTTFSSNAPIGDSAPTSSELTQPVFCCSNRAMWPFIPKPIPERYLSRRYIANLSTRGNHSRSIAHRKQRPRDWWLPANFHATPADFSAHYYNRGNYKVIAPQIAIRISM